MDKETSPSSDEQPEAKIIPFPDRDKDLKDAMRRHPSGAGRETIAETLARLGLDDTPDDPDTS